IKELCGPTRPPQRGGARLLFNSPPSGELEGASLPKSKDSNLTISPTRDFLFSICVSELSPRFQSGCKYTTLFLYQPKINLLNFLLILLWIKTSEKVKNHINKELLNLFLKRLQIYNAKCVLTKQ